MLFLASVQATVSVPCFLHTPIPDSSPQRQPGWLRHPDTWQAGRRHNGGFWLSPQPSAGTPGPQLWLLLQGTSQYLELFPGSQPAKRGVV